MGLTDVCGRGRFGKGRFERRQKQTEGHHPREGWSQGCHQGGVAYPATASETGMAIFPNSMAHTHVTMTMHIPGYDAKSILSTSCGWSLFTMGYDERVD